MEYHLNNITEPCILRQLRTEKGREMRKMGIEEFKYNAFYPRQDGIANTLTLVSKDNYLLTPIDYEHNTPPIQRAAETLREIAQKGRQSEIGVMMHSNYDLRTYRADRADKPTASEFDTKYENNMSNTISTTHPGNVYGESTQYRIRKLTPRECFRLMGVGEKDIDKIQSHCIKTTLKSGEVREKPISKSAMYKCAGNSIVVDVLFHIFRTMFIADQPENRTARIVQKSLFD